MKNEEQKDEINPKRYLDFLLFCVLAAVGEARREEALSSKVISISRRYIYGRAFSYIRIADIGTDSQ